MARHESRRNGVIVSVSAREYWRLRVERLDAAGICIHCGKNPRIDDTKRCGECTKRLSNYNRRYYNKSKNKAKKLKIGHIEDGATFREIGLAIGVSRTRAEQIYLRAMDKVAREFKRMGITEADVIGRGFSMLATAEKWS